MRSDNPAVTLPDGPWDDAAVLLAALAHPVRLRIVAGLLEGSCCVGDMVHCLDLPQPVVSKHLAVLREAGVLQSTAEGKLRRYHVTHPLAAQVVAVARLAADSIPPGKNVRPS
jgi:DNA-binding transcriptional ArsR family regulator